LYNWQKNAVGVFVKKPGQDEKMSPVKNISAQQHFTLKLKLYRILSAGN
jgi:hypothetical protein